MTDDAPSKASARLANEIIDYLSGGIRLDDATAAYVENTIGDVNATHLQQVLKDPDDDARDTLLALLFSADETLQLAVEPMLARHAFSKSDQTAIAGLLQDSLPQAAIVIPGATPRPGFAVPGWALKRLVEGLNITWHPAGQVARAIEEHIPAAEQLQIRVALRNLNFTSTRQGLVACAGFMSARRRLGSRFRAYFNYLAGILCRLSAGTDIHAIFDQRRQHYLRAYNQALRFETLRLKHNMETLMLQGITTPAMGAAQAMQMVVMIDDIVAVLTELGFSFPAG